MASDILIVVGLSTEMRCERRQQNTGRGGGKKTLDVCVCIFFILLPERVCVCVQSVGLWER